MSFQFMFGNDGVECQVPPKIANLIFDSDGPQQIASPRSRLDDAKLNATGLEVLMQAAEHVGTGDVH